MLRLAYMLITHLLQRLLHYVNQSDGAAAQFMRAVSSNSWQMHHKMVSLCLAIEGGLI